jgi:hypothetical protein
MGSLSGTTILSKSSTTVANETYTASVPAWINSTGYTLSKASTQGFSATSLLVINATDGTTVPTANYTYTSAGVVTNTTPKVYSVVNITYTYNYNTQHQNNLEGVLTNTSSGVTGFFSSINPVYAILAVLVIILVLVVLVRVVQSPERTQSAPQL